MNLTPSTKFKIKLGQIIITGLVWGLVGALDTIITWCIGKSHYMEPNEFYDFKFDILLTTTGFLVGGLAAGALILIALKNRWNKKPFWVAFVNYSLAIFFFHCIISWLFYGYRFSYELQQDLFDSEVIARANDYFSSPPHLGNTIVIMMLTTGTILWIRVNKRYGPGNLLSSFLGKYHHPKEEERIFMFLDMKSSTTIAEKLGHIRFYKMLNDFFADLSDPILYSKGEVYQYVGDEIVVSWTLKNGLENANCIRCFYEMKKEINKKKIYYQKKYDGIFPTFKAGLNVGTVTTGEIGEIKRDLVHTGDVVNTTARIQEKCNELNVKIILSEELLVKLILIPAQLKVVELGIHELRGKKEKVNLFTLEERHFDNKINHE